MINFKKLTAKLNLTLSIKFLLIFLTVISLFSLVWMGGEGYSSLSQTTDSMRRIHSGGVKIQLMDEKIKGPLNLLRQYSMALVLATDKSERQQIREVQKTFLIEIDNSLNSFKGDGEDEEEVVEEIYDAWETYKEEIIETQTLLEEGRLAEASLRISGQEKGSYDQVLIALNDWLNLRIERSSEIYLDSQEKVKHSLNYYLALVSVLGLLLVFLSLLIIKRITSPLSLVIGMIKSLNSGDLSKRVKYLRDDELGQVGSEMNHFADELKTIISNIEGASAHLFSQSDSSAQRGNDILNGASQVSNSLQEISLLSENLSGAIRESKARTKEASGLAEESFIKSKDGIKDVKEIQDAVKAMLILTRDVSSVIQTIQDIAFKTSLLSFNSSIEAARAGEHGKGFSVIAKEIQTLAAKTSNASESTEELLEKISESTKGIQQISSETTDRFENIQQNYTRLNDFMDEISSMTAQQTEEIESLEKELKNIRNVTKKYEVAAREATSENDELRSEAEKLKQIISHFKTDSKAQENQEETKTNFWRRLNQRITKRKS